MFKKCYGKYHGHELVPVENFGRDKSQSDGIAITCKECNNRYHRERRKVKELCDKQKEHSKTYYQKNKQSYIERKRKSTNTERGYRVKMLAQARCRARDANVVFDLSLEDLTIPNCCPVLGIPLKFNITGNRNKGKGGKDSSPSLDRIDPNKGYTKDNIVIVSWRANRLKSDATQNELERLYEFYVTKEET